MLVILLSCMQEPPETTPPPEPTPVPQPQPQPQPTEPDPPVLTSEPEILLPSSPTVRLVQRLVASTDRPTRVTLAVNDGSRVREIAFPDLATDHDLPLLALRAETSYSVDATFTDADGLSVQATLGFDTDPLPSGLPLLEIVYSELARSEPGYTVFPAEVGSDSHLVVADAEGRIVGLWDAQGIPTRAVTFAEGAFTSLLGKNVRRWTPLGEVLDLWTPSGSPVQGTVALPVSGIHHEAAFAPDGSFWSLQKESIVVPDYPTSEADPAITAPAEVDDDVVVHFSAGGALLHEWGMSERLDPNRIGFGSVKSNGRSGFDWAHANAIVPLPDEGMVLVSMRHQDALVKLSLPDGELQWILGNPDGWDPAFAPYLLTPTPGTRWPYHQHGPMIGPDGRIWLFDNGNDQRTTPYSQDPELGDSYSRIVQYEVDEEARTVTQTFESFGTRFPGGGYRLYSQALGNADLLPTTSNVLATFAYLHQEGGVTNQALGRGARSARLIEVDPSTGDTVWDLRLYTTSATPQGVLTDRAIRVSSLYGPGVTERWLE